MVFSVDLIREKILDYLLATGRPSDMMVYRQVCKVWLEYISKKYLKSGHSLFLLDLTDTNMISPTLSGFFQNKLMSQFISEFAQSQEAPPLQVKLDGNFFIHENYSMCRQLFERFGESMVTIWVDLPGTSLPFLLPNLQLPNLDRFECRVVSQFKSSSEQFLHEVTTYLVQAVLSASQKLNRLSFNYEAPQNIPSSFGFLEFPRLLQELTLSCPYNVDDFTRLVLTSPLACLRHLKLDQFGEHLLGQGFESRILDKLASTLETFVVIVVSPGVQPLFPNRLEKITIPEVNVLKKLNFQNMAGVIENSEFLSNLTELNCGWQFAQNLAAWRGSVFPQLKTFQVDLVHETSHPLQYVNLTVDMLDDLNTAFPNMTSFGVRFVGEEISGLEYIFEKMTRLTHLDVTFTGYGRNFNEPVLTAKLLGITQEQGKKLNSHRVMNLNPVNPSITNLSQLRSLSIQTARYFGPSRSPLLSDAVFQYGFMRLKNLTHLHLRGEVEATREQWKRWKTHLACRL